MRRLIAVAGCLAVTACGPMTGGGYPAPTTAAYPTTGPATAAALMHDRWTTLPPAPITARSLAAMVWDGREMLVWGGAGDRTTTFSDGASYNPQTKVWAPLPPSPLSARYQMANVWTGRYLFIWGGSSGADGNTQHSDGAIYDPQKHFWHWLPPAPSSLVPGWGAQALWTGDEVVVLSGQTRQQNGPDGYGSGAAAYNPATGRWHLLPPMPAAPQGSVVVRAATNAGGLIYVWQTWEKIVHSGNATTGHGGLMASVYDEATNRWTAIPVAPPAAALSNPLIVRAAFWTGKDFIMPATQQCLPNFSCGLEIGQQGYLWDPASNDWSRVAHGPVDDLNATSVWTGAALLSVNSTASIGEPGGTNTDIPGEGAVWNPATGSWSRLPDATPIATYGDGVVWAGDRLLIWGGSGIQLGP